MEYLRSTFFWLGVSILMHIIINKLRIILGISRFGTLCVFIVGLVGSIFTTLWLLGHVVSGISLPYTSVMLYVFCSLAYLSIAGAPILGNESPTTKVLIGLRRKGPLSKKQILSLFTYDEVIGKRINDLIQSQWIERKGNRVIVTKRGAHIVSFFLVYRKLLRLSEGG